MSLYVSSTGSGPDVVLIHGWGMNSDVWESIIPELAENYCVTVVDLPGHGRSIDNSAEGGITDLVDYSLSNLASQVMAVIPEDAIVVGWSLGGMVATQMVLDYPGRIKKLVLVASSPQFVKDDSWPEGMEADVLNGFAGDLLGDYRKTITRFIAIQAMGSDNAREEQRILRDRVFRHGHPQLTALEGGLKILNQTNLRPYLSSIKIPTLLITGEHDTLFRRKAAEKTEKLLSNASLRIIKGSGHAPFLSHQNEFLQELIVFIES